MAWWEKTETGSPAYQTGRKLTDWTEDFYRGIGAIQPYTDRALNWGANLGMYAPRKLSSLYGGTEYKDIDIAGNIQQMAQDYAPGVGDVGATSTGQNIAQVSTEEAIPGADAGPGGAFGTEDTGDAMPAGMTEEEQRAYRASIYDPLAVDIDKTIGELMGLAQGDYDFAAKWIESEYKTALGTDDVQRQEFLKSVASELENQIGTIAYDYRTGKYRTEQDKELALSRLAEDETTLKKQYGLEATQARRTQGETLSKRGLLTGTREETVGLGSRDVGELEQSISDRTKSLESQLGRSRQDITTGAGRTLEDLRTTARRGGIGAQKTFDFKSEEQTRALDREKRELEMQREREKKYAEAVAKAELEKKMLGVV